MLSLYVVNKCHICHGWHKDRTKEQTGKWKYHNNMRENLTSTMGTILHVSQKIRSCTPGYYSFLPWGLKIVLSRPNSEPWYLIAILRTKQSLYFNEKKPVVMILWDTLETTRGIRLWLRKVLTELMLKSSSATSLYGFNCPVWKPYTRKIYSIPKWFS